MPGAYYLNTNRLISVLIAGSLVVGLFGASPTFAARAQDAELPIDPAFLQYAGEHPDDYFSVIVHKAQNNGNLPDLEKDVEQGGGRLKKQLDLVSAGNSGTTTLYPPANDPFVITVGATDDKATVSTADDTLATFSAYGITESGFPKPDLVAPGRLIISLLPENDKLSIGLNHASNRLDKTYFKMSGTSVSAPMVSGAVAILLQDEPTLTADQVKYRLMVTANKSWAGYTAASAGAGYLNIYNAVYGTTTQSANIGITPSQLLTTGTNPILWSSVGWNSVGWNSVGWNSDDWTP